MTQKLTTVQFGEQLLDANDLDPVYTIVHHSGMSREQTRRFLVAYWCFYHVGTASWICDAPVRPHDTQYWRRMEVAAGSKEYPRSSERRHYRGQQAVLSVQHLKSLGLMNMFSLFDQAAAEGNWLTATRVMTWARDWRGFGPWISFKVADMIDRVGYCRVKFTPDEALYESPLEGAKLMWETTRKGPTPDDVGRRMMDVLINHFDDQPAPPLNDRKFSYPEAETVLCKWKSYMGGHYHIGEDVTACRKSLTRFETPTAALLINGGIKGGLWDA